MDNGARSPSKPDPRQRVAGPLFRAIAPLVRFVLRRGLGEPNVLLTVRGRVTGRPRSTPVAMWELGDRRFVQASFGDVNWVRNLRASGEAVISRGGWSLAVHATELAPADAGRLMHDALAGFRRRRLPRILLGPTVRPPVAILHRYRFQVDDDLEAYVAEARRAPLFELVPREADDERARAGVTTCAMSKAVRASASSKARHGEVEDSRRLGSISMSGTPAAAEGRRLFELHPL